MLDCVRIVPYSEFGHRQIVVQIGPQRIAWANAQGLLREFYGAFRVSSQVLDIGEADERYQVMGIELMTLPRAHQSVLEAVRSWSVPKQQSFPGKRAARGAIKLEHLFSGSYPVPPRSFAIDGRAKQGLLVSGGRARF